MIRMYVLILEVPECCFSELRVLTFCITLYGITAKYSHCDITARHTPNRNYKLQLLVSPKTLNLTAFQYSYSYQKMSKAEKV
jgi:hypothetical protein